MSADVREPRRWRETNSNAGDNAARDWGANEWFVAETFEDYQSDPQSVPEAWQNYFALHPGVGEAALAGSRASSAGGDSSAPADLSRATISVESAFTPADSAPGTGAPDTHYPIGSGRAPGSRVEVTRSDLPPAPKAAVASATSPYTRRRVDDAVAADLADPADPAKAVTVLRGPARAVAKNMDASLRVPTATSAREMPAKLLIDNRALINATLQRTKGGKVSFTHLIGYALVEALVEMPAMNVRYLEDNGKPAVERFAHVGLGMAVDVPRADGSRSLMVPVVKDADTMTFPEFRDACNELITKARTGKLTATDFQGISVSLTNPGTLGTTHSVPRLMPGQGAIIGVGATDFPADWAGVSDQKMAELAIGKVTTVTSTYDHRVIQGAQSGEFLRLVSRKLTGEDGFYDRVFDALEIPYAPYRWARDMVYNADREKGKPSRIVELIQAYRSRGHLAADTDPLSYRVRRHPDLEISSYGLNIWDLDRVFATDGFGTEPQMRLRDILAQLRETYAASIGIEYMHIQDPAQRLWVQGMVERPYQKPTPEQQQKILNTLIQAEAFEEFLQTKFVGQKRFSLEGGESLIPLLDEVLYQSAAAGLYEVAIGMAHRGRLNVLANIAGKSYAQIFSEFEGHVSSMQLGSGDVKYHLGTEGVYTAGDGLATKVYLAANPSHLEAADGVLEGVVRGKQDGLDEPGFPVLPVLVHGDAAFIGQGVVSEIFNMSQVEGFRTGGTVHIIVNNQIGFTTGPAAGRSTHYATDLAKGLQLPVFHVNADDPEAVSRVAQLAFAFRQEFFKDVLIDLVCYRRRGHNEGDDPSMTQPVMYSLIDRIPSTREVYTRNLVGRGDITLEQAQEYTDGYHQLLSGILDDTREHGFEPDRNERHGLEMPRSNLPGEGMVLGWQSAAPADQLERVGQAYNAFPQGFEPHKKLRQLSERRLKMTTGELPVDWGFAELLAFGTLLMDGTPVRITGQDTRRATFVQRHATLHDQRDGREFTPLSFLTPDQAPFDIFDSPLSEYAPLAFEYGYSIERPDTLVLWEAQFGDFVNGAQTVIDEFISSAEQKWGQQSKLVMLLPHGYEGQGPDHSSARIERFLSLAGDDNMRICQPSTPANHFHLLRQQAYVRPRKPLIEFTPKQLLRLSAARSPISDFTSGEFEPVLGDCAEEPLTAVRQVLLCAGRVYYDLAKRRQELGAWDTAIVRLEQYYPMPVEQLAAELAKYPDAAVKWVQDEPQNQGAWPFLALNLFPQLGALPVLVSRPSAASPATGLGWLHRQQAAELMEAAFSE